MRLPSSKWQWKGEVVLDDEEVLVLSSAGKRHRPALFLEYLSRALRRGCDPFLEEVLQDSKVNSNPPLPFIVAQVQVIVLLYQLVHARGYARCSLLEPW